MFRGVGDAVALGLGFYFSGSIVGHQAPSHKDVTEEGGKGLR